MLFNEIKNKHQRTVAQIRTSKELNERPKPTTEVQRKPAKINKLRAKYKDCVHSQFILRHGITISNRF
jgi:hypothetical protein